MMLEIIKGAGPKRALSIIESPLDKTNNVAVRLAKTQISLGIRLSDQSLRCALNG